MAIESVKSSAVRLRLNGGTSPTTGSMRVRSVKLGNMLANAAGDDILAVVGNLLACLNYPLIDVERAVKTTLEN
jgi:hypothetical protein